MFRIKSPFLSACPVSMCLLPPSLSLSAPAPLTSRHSPNHHWPSLSSGCLHQAGACAGSLMAGHLHHSRRPSTSPDVHTYPHPRCEVYRLSSAKIYLEVKASGRSKTHHGLALSADFLTPKEPFCTCVVSPESRGRGWRSGRERRSLNPLPKQDFSPLCSCHGCYLKVFTRDKTWLLTLFILLLLFQMANRRPIVKALPGAHLSSVSGNANRRLIVKHPP